MGLSATSPAQKLTFLLPISADAGSPTSVLGFQPIIWLLSPSTSGVRRPEVTKYQHLLISPLWPTFSLNGHFFDGYILLIQTRGVVILSPSSQWDIAWQYLFFSYYIFKSEKLSLCTVKVEFCLCNIMNDSIRPLNLGRWYNKNFVPKSIQITICFLMRAFAIFWVS